MTDSVTFDGDVEALRESAEGVRATEGPRDTVDVYDERFGIFRRVDKGDKVEPFGDGFTVVRDVQPLGTDKNVSTRGAQGDEDTSVAGGYLTAQNPNVQQEVKDGGPTHEDKASGPHVEGADPDSDEEPKNGAEGEKKAKKTSSAKKSSQSDKDKEADERAEAEQAKASQGTN